MVASDRLLRLCAAVALAALAVVPVGGCEAQSPAPPSSTISAADLKLIRTIIARVQDSYLTPVETDTLVANALKGMLSGLDPHSEYMDEQDYQDMLSDTRGQVEGVGLDIDQVNGTPQVVAADRGRPGDPRRHQARRPHPGARRAVARRLARRHAAPAAARTRRQQAHPHHRARP